MDATLSETGTWRLGHTRWLIVAVVFFLCFRLAFDLLADPLGDEAYYWMWGQHPALSYFDHPPLHAWLLGVVSFLGWNRLTVRLLTWLSLGIVFWTFWLWSRRLAPSNPDKLFWPAAALYASSPYMLTMTTIAYNDHLAVALSLFSTYLFAVFTERFEAALPGALKWLYGAAVALGLATLSKYNAAVVGLAFGVLFLVRPGLRPLLRSPHPWLAGLLVLLLQTPVLVWNIEVGFASFRFHLADRWTGNKRFDLLPPFYFIILNVFLFSPFLLVPLWRLARARTLVANEAQARQLAFVVFAVSSVALLGFTLVRGGYFYWNILAFPALYPLLARYVGRLSLWLNLVFGLLCAGVFVLNFTAIPMFTLVGMNDRGTAINFGWTETVEHVRSATKPGDFVAATRYSTTSQLGFGLGRSDVVPIAVEPLQEYAFWVEEKPLAGRSAVILTDESNRSPVIKNLHARFDKLELVDSFATVRFGREIYRWRIFRGEGYRPQATPPP